MTRRINLIGICAISCLCIILLFASHRFTTTSQLSKYATEYLKSDTNENMLKHSTSNNNNFNKLNKVNRYYNGLYNSVTMPATQNTTVSIDDILNLQRERILEEMSYFEYPDGRFGIDASKLSELTPETNGVPFRSIIITTWRSGSTFLGDILNSLPANYYHYEPLLKYEIIQIRGPPYDHEAINNLKKLLTCDYKNMNEYLSYGQQHNNLFIHNTRLWRLCKLYPNYCWEPKFLEPFCKLFPLQSMKVVRLRLALAAKLLEDESLNARIVLLMRDPRGALQSRKHRNWCPGKPDCDHAPTVCKDMISDYYAAEILLRQYPMRFRALRYEDLSLNPYDMTQDVLQFYGLPFDPSVEEFLDSHTKLDIGGVSSTFRDSKSAPFHWIKDLSFDEISEIQESCTKAMELWGYKKAENETVLNNNFDPLLKFPLL